MKHRQLGTIEVSPIGMGCMGLSHGYGDIPSEEYSIEAIRKAYEFGCTFFDTAEAYGPNMLRENRGHNERIVGKALKDVRQKVVIATKLHLPASEAKELGVYTAIRQHLEASLERLQTDYTDLYYWHRVNRDLDLEEVAAAFGRGRSDSWLGTFAGRSRDHPTGTCRHSAFCRSEHLLNAGTWH